MCACFDGIVPRVLRGMPDHLVMVPKHWLFGQQLHFIGHHCNLHCTFSKAPHKKNTCQIYIFNYRKGWTSSFHYKHYDVYSLLVSYEYKLISTLLYNIILSLLCQTGNTSTVYVNTKDVIYNKFTTLRYC